MLRSSLVVALLVWLGACAPVWKPQTIPGCYLSAGAPELDRERSYYAVLLALGERSFEIVHADAPRQVEAQYYSDHQPTQALAHWLIDVRADGVLALEHIPADTPLTRRRERTFELFGVSLRRLSCRDLAWLRWEAQNRGLVPMPTAAAAVTPPEPPSVPQPSASAGAHMERIASLQRERALISLTAPRALAISGAVLGLGSLSLAIPAFIDLTEDCVLEGGDGYESCPYEARGQKLAIASASLLAGAVALAVTGLTLLAKRKRQLWRIRRELLALTPPVLSGGVDAHGVNLSLRGTF